MLSRIVLVISLALVPLFYVLDSLLPTQYIFDPADLQAISQLALAQNQNWTEPEPLLRKITQELRAKYGDAIGDWSKEDWLFNNAGGAMVSLLVSLSVVWPKLHVAVSLKPSPKSKPNLFTLIISASSPFKLYPPTTFPPRPIIPHPASHPCPLTTHPHRARWSFCTPHSRNT